MKSKYLWTPILMAASAIVGTYIGRIATRSSQTVQIMPQQMSMTGNNGSNKMQAILELIRTQYVDTIGIDTLVEDIIPKVLAKLDPHSVYIPAKDFERVNEDLKSDFAGIGVMFSITDDTVRVVSVVSGGPSSLLGVMPGDKIIKVDGQPFVGDSISNDMVMNRLRGKLGTQVDITVMRDNNQIDFAITRGIIPIYSVEVAYSIEPGIGYMLIDRFAEKTYEEMLKGIAKLRAEKCNTLIIDLRGNSGGLLDVVINMCNEFLSSNDLIVYTEGVHHNREEARANGLGTCQQMNVVVLIDEFSASASEIFAGAMQDNDRGIVIGRRSFGKGLVQTQMPLADNSAIRLTVARYHTPSGRCIQRPYDEGTAQYYDDLYKRYESGELFEADSVKFDENQRFQTKSGRTVFGGGGIMPDIFVARDTTKISDYLYKLRAKGIIYRFAIDYADKHRKELSELSTQQLIEHLCNLDLLPSLKNYAQKKGIHNKKLTKAEEKVINLEARAYIGRNIKDNDAFYPILNTDDPVIERTLNYIHHNNNQQN